MKLFTTLGILFFASFCSAQHWNAGQFLPDSVSPVYSATTGSEFGWSTAASDLHVIVGSLINEAVIYKRNESTGVLEAEALLTPTVGGFTGYGQKVAIDDSVAAVGAPFYMNTGAVFVYRLTGTGWGLEQILEPSDGGSNDNFGRAVAISGNNIVVGSSGNDGARGAAYLFGESGNTWTQMDKYVQEGANPSDEFGRNVDLNGDLAVCVAPQRYNGTPGYTGTASILSIAGGQFSILQTILLAADQWNASDQFGGSVCISESNQIFIGATGSEASGVAAGAVFGWFQDGPTWFPMQPIVPETPQAGEQFGTSISTKDGDIAIGAPGYDSFSGRTFLGLISPHVYFQIQVLEAQGGGSFPSFGQSTAFMLGSVIVGANYGNTYVGFNDTGRISRFDECDETIDGNINISGGDLVSQEQFADTYTWYWIDQSHPHGDIPVQVGTGTTLTASNSGQYVLVIEKNGCFKETTVTVSIVGIVDSDSAEFTIQPNPVKDVLVFSTNIQGESMEILSIGGKVLKTEPLNGQRFIDVSDLASGIYILRLSGSDGHGQQRFLKVD